MFKCDKGYSLLEALMAAVVTTIVLTAALRLLTYASGAAAHAIVRGELTECARTAANVMNANIQRASEINVKVNGNNTLERMVITVPNDLPLVFSYNPGAGFGSDSYHRLLFTGVNENPSNKLASNIADIRILPEKENTVQIVILTDDAITAGDYAYKYPGITVKPVCISFTVNINGKIYSRKT